MKSKIFYSAILVAALIVAGSTTNKLYGQTKQTKTVVEKSVKYTCPMHAEVVADKPGKCPKCGMALVEKKDMPKGNINQAKDSSMMKHDNMKMKHDSTMMKHENMKMMHDSTKMKKDHMIHDTTYMKLEKKDM